DALCGAQRGALLTQADILPHDTRLVDIRPLPFQLDMTTLDDFPITPAGTDPYALSPYPPSGHLDIVVIRITHHPLPEGNRVKRLVRLFPPRQIRLTQSGLIKLSRYAFWLRCEATQPGMSGML